jgi:hypothetical protein
MAPREELVPDSAERLQQVLRLLGGLEALQDSLAFAHR